MNKLKIFISSPGDVGMERLRAHLVIQKLARDYRRFFDIEPVLWEYEPMLASGHFQDAILAPSEADILVMILWARLGTSLPEQTSVRKYVGLDGRSPVTGTEWEFENALAANRAKGSPDLLVYRRQGDPGTSLTDAIKRVEQEHQWGALQTFWSRYFENAGLFIAGSAQYAVVEEFEQKLLADLEALITRRIETTPHSPSVAKPSWLKGSPFRGLAAYDFGSAPIFFGRDFWISTGVERLSKAAHDGTAFLLVIGPSGSGKSSLASAGLLPALTAPKAFPGVAGWRRIVFRPGGVKGPIGALAEAILKGDEEGVGLPEVAGPDGSALSLETYLRAAAGSPSLPFINALASLAGSATTLLPHEKIRLVIVIDQLEEVATNPSISSTDRNLFFELIHGLARSGEIFVIGTLRSDFWHKLALERSFVNLVEAGQRLDLTVPEFPDLLEIIHRPAAVAGLNFETDEDTGRGLDSILASETLGQGGTLPMLSVCLDDLYRRDVERVGGGQTLTMASWRAIGGLRAAIHQRAEEIFSRLQRTDPEAADSLSTLLRAAVTTGVSADTVTARAVPISAFPEGSAPRRLIEAFIANDARLLIAEDQGAGPEVRLVHEALITDWQRAHNWISENRRDIETEALLSAMHRRYSDATLDTKALFLLEGLNLQHGLDLIGRLVLPETGILAEYIAISKAAADQSEAEERTRAAAIVIDKQRSRRSLHLAILATVATVIIAVLAFVLNSERLTADKERLAAEQQKTIADLNAAEAEKQHQLTIAAEESRAEAEKAGARAQEANFRASANEQKALASLTETRKALVASLVTQTDLDLLHDDLAQALTNALKAGEIERTYIGEGSTEQSDAAIWKALSTDRQVFHIQRHSNPWGWPFAFIGDSLLAYMLGSEKIVVLDLANRKTLWEAKIAGLEHPFLLKFHADSDMLVIGAENALMLFDTVKRSSFKTYDFAEKLQWFDIAPGGDTYAAVSEHNVAIWHPFEDETPKLVKVPVDIRNNPLQRVAFDRSASRVYIIDSGRVIDMDMKTRRTREIQFTPQSRLPNLLANSSDLTASKKQDQILFYRTGLDMGSFDARTGTMANLRERLMESLSAGGDGYRIPVGFHYPEQDSSKNLFVISRSNRDNVVALDAALVEDDKFINLFQLRTAANGFATHSLQSCRLSDVKGFLACTYEDASHSGLIAWTLSDGADATARQHKLIDQINWAAFDKRTGAAALIRDTTLFAGTDLSRPISNDLSGWRLLDFVSPFVLFGNSGNQLKLVNIDNGDSNQFAGQLPTFDQDGRHLYTLSADSSLVAYDTLKKKEIWTQSVDDDQTALFLRGRKLISISKANASIFDADTRQQIATFKTLQDLNAALSIDEAGNLFAYRDAEGRLRVLDFRDGQEKIISGTTWFPTALAFSPDATTIFVGGYDGSLTAWRLSSGSAWKIVSPTGISPNAAPLRDMMPLMTVSPGQVVHIFPSSDGKFVGVSRAGQNQGDLIVHASDTGRTLMKLPAPLDIFSAQQVSFGADGNILVFWDAEAAKSSFINYVDNQGAVSIDKGVQTRDGAMTAGRAALSAVTKPARPDDPFVQRSN